MKIFCKIAVLLFTLSFLQVSAKPGINSTLNTNGILIQKQGKSVDGKWNTLSSFKVIERVDQKFYRQNAVYVKLKNKTEISNDKKSIKNPVIQATIANLSVNNINAPFEKFVKETPESDPYSISRIYQVNYDLPIDPYAVCEDLMKNPEVEYATPVFIRYAYDFSPDDPRFKNSEQYFLDVMKMRPAWDITKGNKNIKIADVDSAIDWTHEDLNANIWTNPGEIPNNGIDDDGNGFIDDVHGWDFVGDIKGNEPLKPDNDPKSYDPNNLHGTHTAGCASAVTNNATGVASVGFSCSIIPIKVGADLNSVGGIIAGYEGILYAANLGADVINCSWGGSGYSPAEEDIINTAVSKGSVICASAGNSTELVDNGGNYPASFENVFTVGSTNAVKVSSFSGYGVLVDIYAPGENIMSSLPGNSYGRETGTSMSSPIIAGLVGLVKSIHPSWTPKQLMLQIRGTASNNLVTNQNDRPYYFGMANALAAVTYNNGDPSKKIPGITMESVLINGKTYINDFNSNDVKASFKNYLSSASNVQITFIPQDSWVEITNPTVSLSTLDSNDLKDITVNLKINEGCPWFSGSTKIIVKIVSGTYENYELITLPINLPSDNTFTNRIQFMVNPNAAQLNALTMIDDMNGWAAGNERIQNQGIFCKINNGISTAQINSTEPCYAVYGFSSTSAIMGTGSDDAVGTSHVIKTTNGGANWTSVNTSTITGFINFIHFYDNNNGILLGDPLGTKWGVATTTDGGTTWNKLNSLPDALTAEDGLVGSGQFSGDNIWFGTTMGRVFFSTDRGANWSVSTVILGKPITDMTFSDIENGIVIFSDNIQATANRYLASTSDKALNWKVNPNINFTTMKLFPVYSFSAPDSYNKYILFSNGNVNSSEDNGNTWKPVLSKQYESYYLGDHALYNGRIRLWHVGYGLSFLDFVYDPASLVKKIELADASPIDFGSVQVTKSKTKFIKLKNTGNYKTTIISSEIIPDSGTTASEFEVKTDLPYSIDAGVTYNFRSAFTPATVGAKSATLRLITDGNPANVDLAIIGTADVLSVFELAPREILSVSPNPVSGNAIVNFESKVSADAKIIIYDLLNKELLNNSIELVQGLNNFKVDASKFNPGVYFLMFSTPDKNYITKFIVN